jgi:PAS domain S-box-containing protein
VPVRDADGKIVRWYGTCTDIDDQKRSEDALRHAREALEERVVDRTAELVKANEGLRIEIGERKLFEAERSVLFEIIQGVNTTQNLDELLALAHHAIQKILCAENCFIALHDKRTGLFDMEFFVDQYDSRPAPQKLTRSRTAYVFRTGRPAVITREDFARLVQEGEIEDVGTPPASWLGVPLDTPSERLGVMVVQHYEAEDAYSRRELEFMTSVGAQIALAIARKRAEEALRISEERHRELFENAKDAMYVHDLGGHYTSVNRAAEEMVACKREEIIGKTIADFVSPETLQKIQENLSQRVSLPEQTGYEMQLNARDGRRVDIEVNSRLIYENGVAVAVQGSARDITERKRIEESLRQNERLMAQLLDAMPVGVFVIDANGKPYFSNQVAEQIHGKGVVNDISFEELSETYSSYLTNTGRICPTEELPIVQALRGKTVTASPLEIRRADRVVPIEVWATPIYDADGSIAYALAAFADVTQRRQIEMELAEARDAAVESARLKSEFLANMSHEIRTPMNGVVGMTALLLDTNLNHEQRECAETIRTSGNSLLTIINDILDFSKIEAGKLRFETIDFDLANTLESTVEALAARAREKRIELASLIYSDVPTALKGDSGRLRQILTNLIGNALKFTERGEVVLRAETESVSDSEAIIRFSVTDTGIGISEEAQRNLFRAFTQADGSTTRKYGGTGLGLAISKQLVDLMGGSIGVTSKQGEGSVFWFTARFERQPLKNISTDRAGSCLEQLRALVVDDNATNRKIVCHQLNSWGMIHSEAQSGKQALEILSTAVTQNEAFDIAILDLMMPEMDGFELARIIRADPRLNKTRLVLLTSSGRQGESIVAQNAGIGGYLTKPVRQSQLFDCLASVVGNRDEALRLEVTPTPVPPNPQATTKMQLILLAEDNIVNRKVALRQLQKLGYQADAVRNGREALEAVRRKSYDLVLMDCQMPEMDGYEATAQIRQHEGDSKHTFIVAMTANALKGDRERCLAAGMDEYISKPVQSATLKNVLELVFNRADSITAGDGCPVDLQRLHDVMGSAPDEVQELVELYLEQMDHKLERLGDAIKNCNANDIELIAHNCAGVSVNCGIVCVVEPLRALELMARDKNLDGAAALGEQVSREFERASRYLRDTFTSVTV